jgi:hypothetical protein
MQPQPVAVSPVMAPLQPGEQYLQPASDLPLVINEADRSQPLRLTSVGTMCRGCPTNDHPNGGKYVTSLRRCTCAQSVSVQRPGEEWWSHVHAELARMTANAHLMAAMGSLGALVSPAHDVVSH